MTKLQQLKRKAADLRRQSAMISAAIADEEAREAERGALPVKPRRIRPAEWALPPWQRRRAEECIVEYPRGSAPKGLWTWYLWRDGKPVRGGVSKAGAALLAFGTEIPVYHASDWEAHKAAHPEIGAELARVEAIYQKRLAEYNAATAEIESAKLAEIDERLKGHKAFMEAFDLDAAVRNAGKGVA